MASIPVEKNGGSEKARSPFGRMMSRVRHPFSSRSSTTALSPSSSFPYALDPSDPAHDRAFPLAFDPRFDPRLDPRLNPGFERLWSALLRSPWSWPARSQEPAADGAPWQPPAELEERDDRYLLAIELPGLGKNDVTVRLEGAVLSIEGERRPEATRKEGILVTSERCYGRFHRSFDLPDTVDPEKIAARFEDGLLIIDLAKSQDAVGARREVPVT